MWLYPLPFTPTTATRILSLAPKTFPEAFVPVRDAANKKAALCRQTWRWMLLAIALRFIRREGLSRRLDLEGGKDVLEVVRIAGEQAGADSGKRANQDIGHGSPDRFLFHAGAAPAGATPDGQTAWQANPIVRHSRRRSPKGRNFAVACHPRRQVRDRHSGPGRGSARPSTCGRSDGPKVRRRTDRFPARRT